MQNDPDLQPFDHPNRPAGAEPSQPFSSGFSHHAEPPANQPVRDNRVFAAADQVPSPYPQNPGWPGDVSTPNAHSPRRPGRLKKLLLLIVLPLLLFSGGGAAAYYTVYLPKQPKRIVETAFVSLLNEDSMTGGLSMKISFPVSEGSSAMATIEAVASGDDKDNSRVDVTYTYPPLTIRGSGVYRSDEQALYLKVHDLSAITSMLGNEMVQSFYGGLIETLDKNWVRIDIQQLQDQLGIVASTECIDAFKELFGAKRQQLIDQTAQAYRENRFADAKKVGSETVDGRSADKYQLIIDKQKLGDFLLSDTVDSSTVDAACDSQSLTDKDKADMRQSINDANLDNVHVWIDQDKRLVKLAVVTKAGSTDFSIEVERRSQQLDTAKPSPFVELQELTNSLGIPGLDAEGTLPTEEGAVNPLLSF